jgi:hypothetical protein
LFIPSASDSLRIARSRGRTRIENDLADVTVYDNLFLVCDLLSCLRDLSHCRYAQSPRQQCRMRTRATELKDNPRDAVTTRSLMAANDAPPKHGFEAFSQAQSSLPPLFHAIAVLADPKDHLRVLAALR